MLLTAVLLAAVAVSGWQIIHRSSPLVRQWSHSSFPRRRAGPLSVRDSGTTGGEGEQVLVLLHGLGATGDYFGAFYDGLARQRRVVIVDLLGFGGSLDEDRTEFAIEDHVAAIDQALDALGVGAIDVVLAAHSMSTAIALTWADRHRERTAHVYLWGAPIYPSDTAAESVGKEYGLMGRLFVLDTRWAQWACRLNCLDRDVSGRMMVAMAPRWPSRLSSDAAHHTWEAYHQSLRSLILDFKWTTVLPASCPVTFFSGADDPIGDKSYIAQVAGRAKIVEVPSADHHVALQHPELLANALEGSEHTRATGDGVPPVDG
ncbi:MAG: alpha/beta hydrolase [Ornithinimicrobium sp.]